MKHCLSCDSYYDSFKKVCCHCKLKITTIDGFDSYVQNSSSNDGFKADYFLELSKLEENNFWFQVRNKIIIWALKKYSPNFNSFLEIGCGTGFVLRGIANNFLKSTLNGSEIFIEGLNLASKRLPNVKFIQMDARAIPFYSEFDAIGAFDVLEHIEEDEKVLQQIYKALKPNGLMLLTVPQHGWLWSLSDEYACHKRRYSNKELSYKVKKVGFEIIRTTSFVTALLPAMFLSRFFQKYKKQEFNSISDLKINPILNFLFNKILHLEFFGIKLGINYPIGGSRIMIAKKI